MHAEELRAKGKHEATYLPLHPAALRAKRDEQERNAHSAGGASPRRDSM